MKLSFIFLIHFILLCNLHGQDVVTSKNASKSELKLYQKAVQHYQSNQFEEAIKLFEKLIGQNPKFIDAQLQLASVCYDIKNYSCAAMHFNQVLALDSLFNPKVYYT